MNLRCPLLLAVISLIALSSGYGAPGRSVDWHSVRLTDAPDEANRILGYYPNGSEIADTPTAPEKPFSAKGPFLRVRSEASANSASWFRLHFRPFAEASLLAGAVLMDFQLEKNAVNFQVGSATASWAPEDRECFECQQSYCSISLHPGNPLTIAGVQSHTDSISALEPNVPYTLTAKWDFTQSPVITFFLNGEPLLNETGSAFTLRPKEPNKTVGINLIRVTLGNSENPEGRFLIGRLEASDKPGNVWEPALP